MYLNHGSIVPQLLSLSSFFRLASSFGARWGTDTKAPDLPKQTEREPSSARSSSEYKISAEQIVSSSPIRGCCKPSTARAPAPVSECAQCLAAQVAGATRCETRATKNNPAKT